MENQTRFDLNAAVEHWREELATQPNLESNERRELETHLLDAIAGFQQRGLNEEEAFWLARRRTGQPQHIGEEFVKANPARFWRDRLFWVVLFLFVMWTMQSFAWFIGVSFSEEWWPKILTYTLYSILVIIPIMLCAGMMTRPFSKLLQLIDGRLRLACATAILIFTSLALRYTGPILFEEQQKAKVEAYNMMNAGTGGHMWLVHQNLYPCPISQVLTQAIPLYILALLLILLTPAQNRKSLRGA